jgi:putative Holliday junction resolvase
LVTPDLSQPKTILAFDFGLRRIGVAVGQEVTGSASPIGVVANRDYGVDHDAIATLINEWQPTGIVVGMPSHADGSVSDMQEPVEKFIDELQRYGLAVATVDERYTSVEAERALKDARAAGSRGRISREMIDAAAAVFIAERYLSSRAAGNMHREDGQYD